MGSNQIEYTTKQCKHICVDSFCVPYQKPWTNTEVINVKEGFDFSAALESVYPLVSIVCSYLPSPDLVSVSKISECWRENAEKEIGTRKRPEWEQLLQGKSVFKIVKSSNYGNVGKSKGLLLYNHSKIRLDSYACIHNDQNFNRDSFFVHLSKDIAKGSEHICIAVREMFTFSEPPKDFTPLYLWLNIPHIPDVCVNYFYYGLATGTVKEIIRDDEQLECLLVFARDNPKTALHHMMNEINKRQSHPFSLGGGTVRGISSGTYRLNGCRSTDLFCIGFLRKLATENKFWSASIVSQEFSFEEDLKTLKNTAVMRQHSVIFRFCCATKESSNLEDPLLRKYFPSTLLVQLIVNGEIGCTMYPNLEDPERAEKKSKMDTDLMHDYTSILVFISWGKVKK